MSLFPDTTVESPLGPARVWTTSATHIGAELESVEINRVTYRVRLDLHYRGGKWQRGYLHNDSDQVNWSSVHSALHMSRHDAYRGGRYDSSPSASAREKAADALVPWLAGFAESDAGAELVRAGARVDAAQKRDRIAARRAELEAELEAVAAEELELEERLA